MRSVPQNCVGKGRDRRYEKDSSFRPRLRGLRVVSKEGLMPKKTETANCKYCGLEIFRRQNSYFWYHEASKHQLCASKFGYKDYPTAKPKETV